MNPVFADAFFYLAILCPTDEHHERAVEWSRSYDGRMLTTGWILTELADALAKPVLRSRFAEFYQSLLDDPQSEVVPINDELWERGLRLYLDRPDKDWSLTDCISFTVMNERGLTDALTGDRHFEQAGFKVLLR